MQLLALVLFWGLGTASIEFFLFSRLLSRFMQSADGLQAVPLNSSVPLDIVIPAFNEAINLKACVESILASLTASRATGIVWIANDQSTDETLTIAHCLEHQNPMVRAVSVPPRPIDLNWRGKNWACTYVAERTDAEYLLFIDADIRLSKDCLDAALSETITADADLLTLAPQIQCGCWAE